MPTVLSVVLSLFALLLVQFLLGLRRVTRNVGNLPGPFLLFDLHSVPGHLIARITRPMPYLNPGTTWMLSKKHEEFAAAGRDAISLTTAFPRPKTNLYVADAQANIAITTSRAKFPKDLDHYAVLASFGSNVVVSEGEEWKKYRKAVAPAFSERNNKLVWDETIRIMMDLFDNVWGDKSEIVVDHCVDITLPIALSVISAAGFGRRITWTTDHVVPPGHQMSFQKALDIVSNNLHIIIILPRWAMHLTKRTREIHRAFAELKKYMLEMVEARRNADKVEERYDLFSGLLDVAQDEPDDEAAITAEEIIGNVFIFLLAGHDSTSHTLCFSLALLALYPDEQERLYQNIKGVMSSLDGAPTYENMNHFTYSSAVLYETIRMFPPAPYVPKIAAEDTTLTVNNADGGKTTFPVLSGTEIKLHVPGIHYNPRYWKDPHKFMPERFLRDWPKEAFLAFSQGARACLGRRFFETEGIAIMTMMVSRYKIEIKEEPEFAGETFEERYARITAFDQGLTTRPLRVPLVFKRR